MLNIKVILKKRFITNSFVRLNKRFKNKFTDFLMNNICKINYIEDNQEKNKEKFLDKNNYEINKTIIDENNIEEEAKKIKCKIIVI